MILTPTRDVPVSIPTVKSVGNKTVDNVVFQLDVKELFKDKGKTYYSLLKGVFAYFFDDPRRRLNHVLVKYDKSKAKILKINELMIHLVLWRANIIFNLPIKETDFYRLDNPTNKMFNNLIESVAKKVIDHEDNVTPQICECIASIKEQLSEIAEGWSTVICNTISIWDTIQFKNRNKKFNELLYTELDKSKPTNELEKQFKQCEKDLVNVIMTDDKNCWAPYIRSGRIKSAQLTKVLCCVGTRPDIDKTIMPWPITRGYIHGFQNVAEFYMESITARDAMLTKNDNVPRSGYLSRKINRLTGSSYINYKVKDCGSKNYLKYFVENEDYLKMAEGKFYVTDSRELKILTAKDTNLIGKTLNLRSMISCACKDGICRTCCGKLSVRLKGTRIGTLPSIKSINPLSQKAMSAKHDTGTKSIKITNEALLKYFYSDGADFYMKSEYTTSKNLYIVVSSEDVEEIVNSSSIDLEDSSVDTSVQLSYVAIRDNGVDQVIENEGMRVVLSEAVTSKKNVFIDDDDSDLILIPINKLDPEDPIFNVILDTEEISKYLNNFIGTIDRISINKFDTYDSLMAEMNRIILDSGFVNKIIHFESIIRNMVRDVNDDTLRPDFSIPGVKYKLLKVSSSIEKKDMFTTLSFQGLRRLLKDLSMRRRMGVSLYDPFFRVNPIE